MNHSCDLVVSAECSYIGWREQIARNQLAGVQFRQLWAIDDTHAIAVGGDADRARTLSYEDGTWSEQDASAAIGALEDVWASASNDAFAVGNSADAGQILRYDGAAWTESFRVSGGALAAIWGAAGDDVFAVGDQGRVVHYDGSGWSDMASGTTSRLEAVWGRSRRQRVRGRRLAVRMNREPPR